tara:strand:+ start:1481 stop:1984 length:504 start_codon:yes stop_codon:yes gene_type:complete
MATLISGSTGVNKVQTGAIETVDLPTGSVLQIVTATTTTEVTTTSTSFVALSNLTLSITPSSTSSKIFLVLTVPHYVGASSSGSHVSSNIFRGSVSGTSLGNSSWGFGSVFVTNSSAIASNVSGNYLDSPNTASAQTYTTAFRVNGGTGYAMINSQRGTLTAMEIAG